MFRCWEMCRDISTYSVLSPFQFDKSFGNMFANIARKAAFIYIYITLLRNVFLSTKIMQK